MSSRRTTEAIIKLQQEQMGPLPHGFAPFAAGACFLSPDASDAPNAPGALGADAAEPCASGLLPGESIDDLQCAGLRLIQRRGTFRFGVDAVLLANFARAKKGAFVVELCAGSGVVSILMSAKTQAAKILGVEIQSALAEMANRSAALNGLSGRVSFICADLRDPQSLPRRGSVDAIVVNPPYLARGIGAVSENAGLSIAKHEISCTLDDAIAAAARLLRPGGAFYMVHRAGRLADIFCCMRARGLEPRLVQLAHPTREAPPALALVSGRIPPNGGLAAAGGAEFKFLQPIWINE